eukprot:6204315-Pleurochrysis_carterae.AAC.5
MATAISRGPSEVKRRERVEELLPARCAAIVEPNELPQAGGMARLAGAIQPAVIGHVRREACQKTLSAAPCTPKARAETLKAQASSSADTRKGAPGICTGAAAEMK